MKPRYSVLLDDPTVLATQLTPIARVVAEVLAEPVQDATQRVRYGGGIVARNVLAPYAKGISRGLARLGLGSFTVSTADFVGVPRARRLGSITIRDEGLELAIRLKPAKLFPWEAIQALHAFALIQPAAPEDRDSRPRRGGDPRSLSDGARAVIEGIREFEERERARVQLGIDLLLEGPLLYRLDHSEPGIYTHLEGRTSHSVENYLLLLTTLSKAVPESVLIPPSSQRFVGRHEFTDILFAKPEELESFNGWIVQALAQGVAFSDEPEDLDDEGLADADDAIVVHDALEADDVDDIDDEDLEDADDGHDEPADVDDDEDLDDDELSEAEQALETEGGAAADADVHQAWEHIADTGRFDRDHVREMLNAAADLELAGEVDAEVGVDPDLKAEVKEAMGFFDASSGAWNVSKLLEGDSLDPDDLASADPEALG